MARDLESSTDRRRSRLDGIAGLAVRRPRRILAVWVLAIAVLGVAGIGLEDKLASHAIYIVGTGTKREREIAVRHFGSESSVVVLLRGPRLQVERQGRQLERFYANMPGAMVFSPRTGGSALPGLSPSPRSAALVVSVKGHIDDDAKAILPSIHEGLDEIVDPPVEASVAGFPAIIDSIERANQSAVRLGELIAVPALLVVLLLVFRSVLAALAPVVVGGAVVIASRGVVDFIAGTTHIEILARGATGMMGLALGVDYSLLIVSRFREEAKAGGSVADAVQSTVTSTGRTVLMAGCGLSLAMIVAPLVLPSAIIFSVALAILVVTVFSVLSALFVVPAFLVMLGPNLDRWSLPARRGRSGGIAAALSERLSARPALVVLPVVLLLAAAAAWSAELKTDAITVAQLPSDDAGRLQQEDVQRTLGPGWVAPVEIAIRASDGPVTTPRRLRALTSFQNRLERDPGVETMTGFAEIDRATRGVAGLELSLAEQQRSATRLGAGLAQARRGAGHSAFGLAQAANGAGALESGIVLARDGASALGGELTEASGGSERLAAGLSRADAGGARLAEGTSGASDGADRLASGLNRLHGQGAGIASSATLLEEAMRTGESRLDETETPVRAAAARLGAAHALLKEIAAEGDPRAAEALTAVDEASAWLTGVDPESDEPSAQGDGASAAIERARAQFDLGLYLAARLRGGGAEMTQAMDKLRDGSVGLQRSLRQLAAGSWTMSGTLGRLERGGEQLSPGIAALAGGAERLLAGIDGLQVGGEELARGLGDGSRRSMLLASGLSRLERGFAGEMDGSSPLSRLRRQAPDLFRSGFLYLAGLDGSAPEKRRQASFLVSLDRGGSAGRMVVVPSYDPADPRASETRDRIEEEAAQLARAADAEVVVGGITPNQLDLDSWLRDQAPVARLALAIVTFAILLMVLRALIVPVLSALLNVLTVAATFGFVALLFNTELLGGPGYVDTTLLPATIVLVFALAIDYEVFVFSRMREEYLRTGSTESAIAGGVSRTAPVVTGAAIVMVIIFLSFAASSFSTMRSFGVAQAIGVAIDAFLIRLVIVPAMMRALGKWAWWMPAWLDRLLPGVSNSVALAGRGRLP